MKRIVPLTIRTVTSLEEFKGLAEEWDQLLHTVREYSFFLIWEWLYYWAKHFLEDTTLRVLLFRDNHDRLIGVAPFFLRTIRVHALITVRELRFLGSETVCSSYLDVIVNEGHKRAVLESLYQYLFNEARKEWDILTLSEIPADSATLDLCNELFNNAGKVGEMMGMTCCPVIRLPRDVESYRATLGRNRRYALQRKTKCLQGAGRVVYLRATSPAEIDAAFEAFVILHQQRWSTGSNGGVFANARVLEFHKELVHVGSERGWISMDLLQVDGRSIAAIYGFFHQGVYYFYLPGFDPAVFTKASPGLLLLSHRIEQAIRDGAHTVDLLQGAQAYKLKWSTGIRRSVTCRYYNRRVRGMALKLIEDAKQAVKILIR